jgi:hypothetical protein
MNVVKLNGVEIIVENVGDFPIGDKIEVALTGAKNGDILQVILVDEPEQREVVCKMMTRYESTGEMTIIDANADYWQMEICRY